jgi:hypothetical protein
MKKLSIILCILAMLWLSCKKGKLSDNIILKDKPLNEIQKYISGKWKLLYAIGGFTGYNRYDFIENYIEFNSNTIYWKTHDTIVANGQIEWVPIKDIWHKNTYVMMFKDADTYPYSFIPDRISNGQLWLVENAADGYGYILEKSR